MYHGAVAQWVSAAELAELGLWTGPLPQAFSKDAEGAGAFIDRDVLADARERATGLNKLAHHPLRGYPDDDGPQDRSPAPSGRPIPTTRLSPLPSTVTKVEDRCPHCGLPRARKTFLERVCSGRCLPFNPSQPRVLP